MQYLIERRRDLRRANQASELWPHALLVQGDADAALWRVTVTDGGTPVDLTGWDVYAEIVRPSGVTVPLTGSADGACASVMLKDVCFEEGGVLTCRLYAVSADVTLTLDFVRLPVRAHSVNRIIDTDDMLPSLPAFLEQLGRLEGAIDAAESLVDTPAYIGDNGNWYVFDPQTLAYIDSGNPSRGEGGTAAASNLLDNSYFIAPVNQRGKSAYADVLDYTIDRWKLTNAAGSLTLEAGKGISMRKTAAGNAYLLQYLPEIGGIYYGKTYTFAVMTTDGSVYTATGTYPAAKPTSGETLANVTIPGGRITLHTRSNRPAPYVMITASSLDVPVELAWAAVYEGAYTADTLPRYIPKGYAAELAECRRYYYRVNARDAYGVFAAGVATTEARIDFVLPVPLMRDGVAQPTFEAGGSMGLIGSQWGQLAEALVSGVYSDGAYSFSAVPPSAAVIGQAYALRAYGDAAAYLALSADL